MSFEAKLKNFIEMIDTELDFFFDEKKSDYNPKFMEVIQICKDFVMRGGKRIRPICVLAGYCVNGNKLNAEIIRACLSTELLHNYFLIHDDIMDEAELRRGKVSVHKFFENYYEDAISGERKKQFGNSMAILAGDLLSAYTFECISKTKFEPEKKEKVLRILADTAIKTIQGQTMDIMSGELRRDLSEKEYLELIKKKTAEYTFKTPMLIGMILAGVENSMQKKVSEYAELLGEAFQLRDDVMDIFSEEKEIGKKECGDIIEGKKTILVSHALEKGSEDDILYLRSVLGKKELDKKDISRIQKIFESTGAKKKVIDMAEERIEKAKTIISEAKIDKGTKIFFIELADYLKNRKN